MKKREIKNLLKKYNIFPSKRLGQNFLIDEKIFKKIMTAANLTEKDIVLEIGAGVGNLTLELAKRVKKVIAIEKDNKLIKILKEALKSFRNVETVQGNILKLDPDFYLLNSKSYKIVANIPYYLTSRLIRKFLERENKPSEMILMLQKEVAKRICATPPKMNLLAISVQFYATPKIISYVSKESFWPKPKVDSAIMKIETRDKRQETRIDRDLFFKIVKAGFSKPRKQLINNLSKELKIKKEKVRNWLLKSGINPTQRAENLDIEKWIKLTKNFKIKRGFKK